MKSTQKNQSRKCSVNLTLNEELVESIRAFGLLIDEV